MLEILGKEDFQPRVSPPIKYAFMHVAALPEHYEERVEWSALFSMGSLSQALAEWLPEGWLQLLLCVSFPGCGHQQPKRRSG